MSDAMITYSFMTSFGTLGQVREPFHWLDIDVKGAQQILKQVRVVEACDASARW